MSVIYLATPEAAAIGELERLATAMGSTPEAMTPGRYRFHTIAVDSLPVLDLRTQEALESVGLSLDDISDDDWTACQAVGEAASFLGIAGVLAPSASGAGFVLAAFETRAAAHLEVVDSEDFTLKLLTRLRTEPS